jgi:hypothetical protein
MQARMLGTKRARRCATAEVVGLGARLKTVPPHLPAGWARMAWWMCHITRPSGMRLGLRRLQ